MERKFKVGDRVHAEGEVVNTFTDMLHVKLDGDKGSVVRLYPTACRSLPTPAQKLRDAADVLVSLGWNDEPGYVPKRLRDKADELETPVAPKPTLREAAHKVLEWLGDVHPHSESLANLRAALSREEASNA